MFYLRALLAHHRGMKSFYSFLGLCLVAVAFSSCGTGNHGDASVMGATGPFDKHGNYVEAWADNPSKWKKGSTPSAEDTQDIPQIAVSDQPPANSVPLSSTPPRKPPVQVASRTQAAEQSLRNKSATTQARVNSTTKAKAQATQTKAQQARNAATKSATASKTTAAKTKAQAQAAVKSKTTASKTATAAKTKAKTATAKTTRVTVKKGDSLSTIASRNGTTVAALKRQNGISGTMIRPGQTLTIPK